MNHKIVLKDEAPVIRVHYVSLHPARDSACWLDKLSGHTGRAHVAKNSRQPLAAEAASSLCQQEVMTLSLTNART